jgi:hypothetical protein
MTGKTKRKGRRGCLIALLALTGACLLLAGLSAMSNLGLPSHQTGDQLPDLDKARLSEALQLDAVLGEAVWPGLASFEAPVILANQSCEFLIGYPGRPPAGWEITPDDTFEGQPYYRRPAVGHQNFAVPVGDLWAASMGTKTEADLFLIGVFRDLFPVPLKQIFPYRLLIQPTETQIGGLLHEFFHVYVQQAAPNRLAAAEAAHRSGDRYEAAAESFESELRQEGSLLAQALEAQMDQESAGFVRRFLQARDERRRTYQLPPELVDYERWLEWEEGTAKYVEVAFLRQAHLDTTYVPLAAMAGDPDFHAYGRFDGRWTQEMIQLRNPSGSSETRFYMLGMAEAFLLDRLLPDWKDTALRDGVFLEDLLRQAVEE